MLNAAHPITASADPQGQDVGVEAHAGGGSPHGVSREPTHSGASSADQIAEADALQALSASGDTARVDCADGPRGQTGSTQSEVSAPLKSLRPSIPDQQRKPEHHTAGCGAQGIAATTDDWAPVPGVNIARGQSDVGRRQETHQGAFARQGGEAMMASGSQRSCCPTHKPDNASSSDGARREDNPQLPPAPISGPEHVSKLLTPASGHVSDASSLGDPNSPPAARDGAQRGPFRRRKKKYEPWTDERVRALQSAIDQGVSTAEIARFFGYASVATVNGIIQRLHRQGRLQRKQRAAQAGSSLQRAADARGVSIAGLKQMMHNIIEREGPALVDALLDDGVQTPSDESGER